MLTTIRKNWIFGFLLLGLVAFTGCNDDNNGYNPLRGSIVHVLVEDQIEEPVTGVWVYMYTDHRPTVNSLTSDAVKIISTDDEGIATFRLYYDQLNIQDGNTQLYFAVFYEYGDDKLIAVSDPLTADSEEEETVVLKLLL